MNKVKGKREKVRIQPKSSQMRMSRRMRKLLQ